MSYAQQSNCHNFEKEDTTHAYDCQGGSYRLLAHGMLRYLPYLRH